MIAELCCRRQRWSGACPTGDDVDHATCSVEAEQCVCRTTDQFDLLDLLKLNAEQVPIRHAVMVKIDLPAIDQNKQPVQPYHLPRTNQLAGAARPQQLKRLQDFVFVVKVYE